MATSTGSPPAGEPPVVTTIIEVLRAASVISTALTPVVRGFGLSLAAFNVLHTLAHADGALSPKEISGRQVIRPQTLSDILGTLEDEGLIDRIRDRRDRRMLLVALSAAGRARYERCCDPLLAAESRLLAGLGDGDLATLRALLGQITEDARLPGRGMGSRPGVFALRGAGTTDRSAEFRFSPEYGPWLI
jgi:MarR family transcriptional regulator, transcriptional regulator for hemolysin